MKTDEERQRSRIEGHVYDILKSSASNEMKAVMIGSYIVLLLQSSTALGALISIISFGAAALLGLYIGLHIPR